MSCSNCYLDKEVKGNLVDRILLQGQRLRNAMVQSILNNDPFNTDVMYSNPESPLKGSAVKLDNLSDDASEKIKAFLQGDTMSRQDEALALGTLRSMSTTDLCKATDRTYRSDKPCDCPTCRSYSSEDLNCDLKRATYDSGGTNITKKLQETYKSSALQYMKFVDSLKVTIHSLVLNEAGNKKVFENLTGDKKASGVTQTYFLEYHIPEVIAKHTQATKSKVDSGLSCRNSVRLCARCPYHQVITFKQSSVHDISALDKLNLHEISLKFNISFRSMRQKIPVHLGTAKFELSSFEVAKDFTCNQELSVRLDENTPIVVGVLKVSVQLGCGRLYFGAEFLDAISTTRENSVVLASDDVRIDDEVKLSRAKPKIVPKEPQIVEEKPISVPKLPQVGNPKPKPVPTAIKAQPEVRTRQILFGFVYVSQAQFEREVSNSFVVCQTFELDEVMYSKEVAFDANPVYNFCQKLPLIHDDELLSKLRDNYLVIEIWEKGEPRNFILGTTSLTLHQFYLAYRNALVAKYLAEKKFPTIAADGWEPIISPFDGETVGQVQVLLALGTKEQVENLERERGFRSSGVRAKLPSPRLGKAETNCPESKTKPEAKPDKVTPKSDKVTPRTRIETADVAVQFGYTSGRLFERRISSLSPNKSVRFDSSKVRSVDVGVQSSMDGKEVQKDVQDINTLLSKLMEQKANVVETATNTEPTDDGTQKNSDRRNTSDLLDSLQRALAAASPKQKDNFKAHVVINNALHLPSRKKCKSKRLRGKGGKHEDILPSTYVTFEGLNGELKMTKIVPKCTSPKWDYRSDVVLPVDFLTNSQKRLIFKVWRKSTNTTMQPNMQTDLVLGFAAVDLTVLVAGLPNVQGWFNIMDFSNKCHGQINIHITPLDDISRYHMQQEGDGCCRIVPSVQPQTSTTPDDEPGELLGRALKRKFTELDEINQRLRLRLSKVTNDESDTSNDGVADEFERDINTLCVEDDFDMIDFEKDAGDVNIGLVGTKSNFEPGMALLQSDSTYAGHKPSNDHQHLIDTKGKIDTLLEKLSIISGGGDNRDSSRYVSGCSVENRIDAESLLNELDRTSRPNMYSGANFDRAMRQKFGDSVVSDSYSDLSGDRAAPEGEGSGTETTSKSTES